MASSGTGPVRALKSEPAEVEPDELVKIERAVGELLDGDADLIADLHALASLANTDQGRRALDQLSKLYGRARGFLAEESVIAPTLVPGAPAKHEPPEPGPRAQPKPRAAPRARLVFAWLAGVVAALAVAALVITAILTPIRAQITRVETRQDHAAEERHDIEARTAELTTQLALDSEERELFRRKQEALIYLMIGRLAALGSIPDHEGIPIRDSPDWVPVPEVLGYAEYARWQAKKRRAEVTKHE